MSIENYENKHEGDLSIRISLQKSEHKLISKCFKLSDFVFGLCVLYRHNNRIPSLSVDSLFVFSTL